MNKTRTSAIVGGAAIVGGSLWAPWYAIDFGPAARSAAGAGASQVPGVLGEFARQLLTLIPTHIEVTAWQVFDKADIILFACAVVALVAALIDRMDIAVFAGVGAGATTVLSMVGLPGPGELVSLKWGAWLALAGSLLIAGASRMGSREAVAVTAPPPDWTRPTAPLTPENDPARSFAPF